MCPLLHTAVAFSAEVFSLRALPLSSELLIKTPKLASGSLSLSFSFTTLFSLLSFLFKHTVRGKGGNFPPVCSTQSGMNSSDFSATRTNYSNTTHKTPLLNHRCHHFTSHCKPFLFGQLWPLWSRVLCVWSPKKLIIALQNGTLEMLVITQPCKPAVFKPRIVFLIIIKVYWRSFIHEVSADVSLG